MLHGQILVGSMPLIVMEEGQSPKFPFPLARIHRRTRMDGVRAAEGGG